LWKAKTGQSGGTKTGIVDQMQSANWYSSHTMWHEGTGLPQGSQAEVASPRGFPDSILQVCNGWPQNEDQHNAGISGLVSGKPWWSGPSANSIDTAGYWGGLAQCTQEVELNWKVVPTRRLTAALDWELMMSFIFIFIFFKIKNL
jgi:hypothetical protein